MNTWSISMFAYWKNIYSYVSKYTTCYSFLFIGPVFEYKHFKNIIIDRD